MHIISLFTFCMNTSQIWVFLNALQLTLFSGRTDQARDLGYSLTTSKIMHEVKPLFYFNIFSNSFYN